MFLKIIIYFDELRVLNVWEIYGSATCSSVSKMQLWDKNGGHVKRQ